MSRGTVEGLLLAACSIRVKSAPSSVECLKQQVEAEAEAWVWVEAEEEVGVGAEVWVGAEAVAE